MTVLPVVVPLAWGAILLALGARPRWQRLGSLLAHGCYLAAAVGLFRRVTEDGPQASSLGNWPPPFGIAFCADALAATLVLLTAAVAAPVALFALALADGRWERQGYHALVQVMLAGVSGAFLTTDLFNLFVWFEVTLISSFVLLTLGGGKAQVQGGFKYVALNLLSSVVFLSAAGLLYGTTGTLNLADLGSRPIEPRDAWLVGLVGVLFLSTFSIKAALFPVFFWLPAAYPTPAAPVAALFAGVLTKVGVYAMLRTGSVFFAEATGVWTPLLLALSVPTMLVGVLGAVVQSDWRRILAFHSVSQVGYMVAAVGIGGKAGFLAAVLFMVHHGLVKSALFVAAGVGWRLGGSYRLGKLGGFARSHGLFSALFLILALSLAGLPPTSGFAAKLAAVRAALEGGHGWIAGAMVATGLFTLYSMVKIWNEAFWKPAPETMELRRPAPREMALLHLPLAAFAAMALLVGLGVGPALPAASRSADLDRQAYVRAVMGGPEP
ncbi:MAG: proton-conducting transporter membrane subunit [Fimbriimonadales bacterium]|nr:proton-conducting transporter membrane subunit [Fimbriimonadales bacterium]